MREVRFLAVFAGFLLFLFVSSCIRYGPQCLTDLDCKGSHFCVVGWCERKRDNGLVKEPFPDKQKPNPDLPEDPREQHPEEGPKEQEPETQDKPENKDSNKSTVILSSVSCTNRRVGSKATCTIKGSGFSNSVNVWISNLRILKADERTDSSWTVEGKWVCGSAGQRVEANVRGAAKHLVSSYILEGSCDCMPDFCSSKGKDCGSLQNNEGEIINCGECPPHFLCKEGKCVCLVKYTSRCKGNDRYFFSTCNEYHSQKIETCEFGCLTRHPDQDSKCRELSPPICGGKVSGQYCNGMYLLKCTPRGEVKIHCKHGCRKGEKTGEDNCLGIPKSSVEVIHESGKCLHVAGGVVKEVTAVILKTCDGSLFQRWLIVPITHHLLGERIILQSAVSKGDFCLDVAAGKTNNDCTNVQLHPCNQTIAQLWKHRSDGRLVIGEKNKGLVTYSKKIKENMTLHIFNQSRRNTWSFRKK